MLYNKNINLKSLLKMLSTVSFHILVERQKYKYFCSSRENVCVQHVSIAELTE